MISAVKLVPALAFAAAVAFASPSFAHGQSCGGSANTPCTAGQYCKTPTAACHAPAAKGSCEETPQICNELYQPVCGCDGVTYANACHAAMKGVSVASQGACAAPVSPTNPGG